MPDVGLAGITHVGGALVRQGVADEKTEWGSGREKLRDYRITEPILVEEKCFYRA
jgi:hypothetical protein